MMFRDRAHAAHLLAKELSAYRGKNPLVLAIPRGALPMAKILAEELNGELDVVLVRKLGAPGNPELAIGSVDETGHVSIADYAHGYGLSEQYIAEEAAEQQEVLRRRRAAYTPVHPPIDPAGRIVIVVDDGIATGSTMIAALHALRAKHPARLVVASAVCAPDALARIERDADDVVCLDAPANFYAVGQFFEDFAQVSDEEVVAILRATGKPSAAPTR